MSRADFWCRVLGWLQVAGAVAVGGAIYALWALIFGWIAIEDAGFDEEQRIRLEKALTDAGVDHLIETYQARHGFAVPDMPVFDPAAAERHWTALFGLFGETLVS